MCAQSSLLWLQIWIQDVTPNVTNSHRIIIKGYAYVVQTVRGQSFDLTQGSIRESMHHVQKGLLQWRNCTNYCEKAF